MSKIIASEQQIQVTPKQIQILFSAWGVPPQVVSHQVNTWCFGSFQLEEQKGPIGEWRSPFWSLCLSLEALSSCWIHLVCSIKAPSGLKVKGSLPFTVAWVLPAYWSAGVFGASFGKEPVMTEPFPSYNLHASLQPRQRHCMATSMLPSQGPPQE